MFPPPAPRPVRHGATTGWPLALRMVLALWLVLLACGARAEPAPLVLAESQPVTLLWPALTLLSDPDRRHTAEELLSGGPAFGPMPTTQGTLGVPVLEGRVTGQNLGVTNPLLGVQVTSGELSLLLKDRTAVIERFVARACRSASASTAC